MARRQYIGCVPTKSMVSRSEYIDADTAHRDHCHEAVTRYCATSARDARWIETVTVLAGHARFADSH